MPGERTEQATQHKREIARRDGDVLHSRELTSAAGALTGVIALGVLATKAIGTWRAGFAAFLDLGFPAHWESAEILPTMYALRRLAASVLLPIGLAMAAVAAGSLCAGILQTGGVSLSGSALEIKFDRVSPAANLKNLFSLRGVSRLGRSLIPASLLGVIAVQEIAREIKIPAFSTGRLVELGADVYGLLEAAAWLMFAWALVDYVVEWRSRESRLKMSREEMREEYKETEGSPQIRSRIRGLQRQMRRRRVKADVAHAALVLTNPTHYAVALGFDFSTMDAPKLLAKGRNLLAEEIKAEARWAGVPIIENPPLARSLYRTVEVGQAIPVELYAAVAAILAYLYRQRVEAELRERRAHARAKMNDGPRGSVIPGDPR
ncbi:MAG TPA: EscU/YscU/HrcU family type III secretion system export apparatus switch protein [Terracidiphilus sp.]|nr:EscU/YscU/HrcU family type III secretion system export apparatus switch protein [Terracidiphilus sp.]